jgi:TolB-like protein/class 3 adenylate cyclase/Flp pilus assembly protein TadD
LAGADDSVAVSGARTKRKLAAILHADVVGFSRMMGADETGTHDRLMAYGRTIDAIVAAHSGRIVKTAGDAILADFPSVIEALSAAIEIQEALAERNASLPSGQRLEFRIGINLGDVIVDGDDIFGDGVNVAARIQALAEPGGIAVSGAVFDQARNKVDFAFHDRGTQRVKNIAEPVRVYAVGGVGAAAARRPKTFPRRAVAISAALAFAAAIAAGLLWLWSPLAAFRNVSAEAPAGEAYRTERPTIAVLPFENRSDDTDQDYFSDGVTEDVITKLGRFSDLLVLSWNAVAPYKDRAVTPEKLSGDLGVRYVVGGTLRRADDRLRVTVQLTDAERGVLLWSERYDEQPEDIFAVQDKIARQVVSALAVRVANLETERAFEKPTEDLGAYDLVLRGRNLLRNAPRDSNFEARALFQQASAIDPAYSEARAGEGWTHLNDFLYGWTEWPDRAVGRAGELALDAIKLDERNASAHALLAEVLLHQREFDQAKEEIGRAVALNPNDPAARAIDGKLMLYTGRPAEAASSLELALRLNPDPVGWWVENLARARYFLGQDREAARLLGRYEQLVAEHPAARAIQAAAYGQLDEPDAAAEALSALKRISPFFDAAMFASNLAYSPADEARLLDGLRKAGLDVPD